MPMSENDRQALNILYRAISYKEGLLSSGELVRYMVNQEFVFDHAADEAVEKSHDSDDK